MKTYNEDEVEKIKKAFEEQIKRKDKEIDELKKTNKLLFKTAYNKSVSKIKNEENLTKNDKV